MGNGTMTRTACTFCGVLDECRRGWCPDCRRTVPRTLRLLAVEFNSPFEYLAYLLLDAAGRAADLADAVLAWRPWCPWLTAERATELLRAADGPSCEADADSIDGCLGDYTVQCRTHGHWFLVSGGEARRIVRDGPGLDPEYRRHVVTAREP